MRAAQGIVGLAKKYGRARLESACTRALCFDNPRYRTVKGILKQGLDQAPLDNELDRAPLSPVYSTGRFLRPSCDLN